MHRCLEIPEILELIFRQVDDGSCCDTLHLVLTCRHFKNHALSLLWRSLESPAPLFMAMPSDLWKSDDLELKFVRRVVPEDWDPFDRYAQYVKEIGMRYYRSGKLSRLPRVRVSRDVNHELMKRRRRPLLPNLTRIHVASPWNVDPNMVPMFLPERVTYLALDDYITPHHKAEGTCFGNFIGGLRHLEHFDSIYLQLPDETIRHLTSLPGLRSLKIPIKDFQDLARICDPKSNPSYRPQLCSLQTLHFLCDYLNPGGCSTALESMNPTSLRELQVSSLYGNLSPGELESLFVALRNHCDPPSFEAVYFSARDILNAVDTNDWNVRHNTGLEESVNHPPLIIPFRILKPFLSDYSSLKFIVLPLHLLDADDNEIEQIAAHLPTLRTFALAVDPWNLILQPRMTLRSILSFVTHCRHLSELALYIDATLPLWPPPEALRHLVHHTLNYLNLGKSTVARKDLGKVRDLLDNLLPNLYEMIWSTDVPDFDALSQAEDYWSEQYYSFGA